MTGRGVVRATREVFLTFGALLGVVCILATVAGAVFDVKPLVFRSGSMSPAIHTGDLGVSRTVDASTLRRGDIVSLVDSSGNRVTHRLVTTAAQGDARQLTLRGDANTIPDAEIYTVTTAEKVIFDVPKAGYVVDAATSPAGLFVLGLYVAGMLALVFRREGSGDSPSGGRRRRDVRSADPKQSARAAARTVGTAAFAASLAVTTPAAAAHWTDPVAISAAYTAHTVSSQGQPDCANVNGFLVLGNIARITWSNVDGRYEYRWELRNLAGTVLDSGVVGGGQAVGADVVLDVSTGLIGSSGNYNVAVRARLKNTPTWIAGSETITPVRRASIIIIGTSIRCGHS